jgi:hypothetical protein
MGAVKKRVHEIALKHCSEYPDIENKDIYEQLYAIEASLQGVEKANQECHKMINILSEKAKLSVDEVYEIWKEKIL